MNTELDFTKCGYVFDEVALLYEQARPGYPDAMIDSLIEHAALPLSASILDIGTGTGKALKPFYDRGYSVMGIDPGENLLAVAQARYPNVQFELTKFEDWDPKGRLFDLVISGQAFHWIPQDESYRKAAEVLRPNGTLALFWNNQPPVKDPIFDIIDSVYDKHLTGNTRMTYEQYKKHYEAETEKGCAEFDASGYFKPCVIKRFPWKRILHITDYFNVLNTYPNHITMESELKKRIFRELEAAISESGGKVTQYYETILYLGKKR